MRALLTHYPHILPIEPCCWTSQACVEPNRRGALLARCPHFPPPPPPPPLCRWTCQTWTCVEQRRVFLTHCPHLMPPSPMQVDLCGAKEGVSHTLSTLNASLTHAGGPVRHGPVWSKGGCFSHIVHTYCLPHPCRWTCQTWTCMEQRRVFLTHCPHFMPPSPMQVDLSDMDLCGAKDEGAKILATVLQKNHYIQVWGVWIQI